MLKTNCRTWILCATMAAGFLVLQTPSGAQPAKPNTEVSGKDVSKSADARGATKLARVRGLDITEADLQKFSEIARIPGLSTNAETGLEDLLLQKISDDVFTTVSVPSRPKSAYGDWSLPQRNLAKAGLRQVLLDGINLSNAQLEAWLEKNSANYAKKHMVKAYHLFMQVKADVPTSTSEIVRQRMETVLGQITSGEISFFDAATSFSEASSAINRGEIGWLSERQPIGAENRPINIRLEKALFALGPKQVSDIIETTHGLHLVYADEIQTTYTPTVQDLVTSGILPGLAKQELLTTELKTLVAAHIKKHNGEVLYELKDGEELSTKTPAFRIAGKVFTVREVEQLYGTAFTRPFGGVRGNPEAAARLFKQVMEDEAIVRIAKEKNVLKRDDNPAREKLIIERLAFLDKLKSIRDADFNVTDDEVRKYYDDKKDSERRPEFEGHIVTVNVASSHSSEAERVADYERARKIAAAARERVVKGEDIAKVANEVSTDDRNTSGGFLPRHAVNELTGQSAFNFRSLVGNLKPGELSGVEEVSGGYAFAKLTNRWPGEPPAFEQVRNNIYEFLRRQNESRARQAMMAEARARKLITITPEAKAYGLEP